MIRTSWNHDGLLQIEMSAEIAHELHLLLDSEPVLSPDLSMLMEQMFERLDKPQHRRGDA
jgi:hypothetical protein